MHRDLLNNAKPDRVSRAMMEAIDRLQNYQPHEQLMGVCALFLFLSQAWGIPAQDVFTATKNLINDADGKRPEFAGIETYIKKELM